MNRCLTPYCKNKVKGKYPCSTCRSRKSREANPVRYAYHNLKSSAAKRDLPFTISLEQFKDWCIKVDYIGHKGRAAASYTCDRRYNDIGYHVDNIQVMTKRNNVKKYFSYDYRNKAVRIEEASPVVASLDDPF